jgi:hypothetical protein
LDLFLVNWWFSLHVSRDLVVFFINWQVLFQFWYIFCGFCSAICFSFWVLLHCRAIGAFVVVFAPQNSEIRVGFQWKRRCLMYFLMCMSLKIMDSIELFYTLRYSYVFSLKFIWWDRLSCILLCLNVCSIISHLHTRTCVRTYICTVWLFFVLKS